MKVLLTAKEANKEMKKNRAPHVKKQLDEIIDLIETTVKESMDDFVMFEDICEENVKSLEDNGYEVDQYPGGSAKIDWENA